MVEQDQKSKRYDRGIRVWGPHGQEKLEKCKVLLLNCGPVGSEALKNLVLGGISGFTIVDGCKVTQRDLGNNFLAQDTSVGAPRAQVVTELLQELNETVSGSYVEESAEVLIDDQPSFFASFNLVIATQLRESHVTKLDAICRSHGVPLLIARIYGLVGYLRASLPEHQVVESKPDSQVEDLRLHTPWPELKEFALAQDMSSMDDVTHHHTPYAIILIQAAEEWRQRHDGKVPATSKERAAFKELINSKRRTIEGIPIEEENFAEAVKHAFHIWTPYTIPAEIRTLFEDPQANIAPNADTFWVMVAALKTFSESEGQGTLPLDGSIPDMHATTDFYLQLQRVYREKAERDIAAVEGHVRCILQSIGRESDSISRETIKFYCKHARNLRVVRWRSLAEECSSETVRNDVLHKELANQSTCGNTSFYILLRAVDRFYAQHGRYPGTYDHQVEEDVPTLKSLVQQLLSECGIGNSNPRVSPDNTSIQDDYILEMCRFGASELHVMGALIGGIASQEAIKLVTAQFVPVAGTLLYNAISCTTSVMEL